jgi:hypothetical protein
VFTCVPDRVSPVRYNYRDWTAATRGRGAGSCGKKEMALNAILDLLRGKKFLVLAAFPLLIGFSLAAGQFLPRGIDWYMTFRPATLAFLSGNLRMKTWKPRIRERRGGYYR